MAVLDRLYGCANKDAAEQKARVTYDNLLRLIDDRDVCDVLKFLREREIVHYQRFGEANRAARKSTTGIVPPWFGYFSSVSAQLWKSFCVFLNNFRKKYCGIAANAVQ